MDEGDYDIVVEATDPDHISIVWRLFGCADILEALREADKTHHGAPGLGLALALAEKHVADLRANMAGESLRAAQSAGYDIVKHREIVTTLKDGKPVLMMKTPTLI